MDFQPVFSSRSLKALYPLKSALASEILFFRDVFCRLSRNPEKKILILGPCSVYDKRTFIAYAKEIAKIQKNVSDHLWILLRAYIEKPRTSIGWKGYLYQRNLMLEENLLEGLALSRELFLEIAELHIPIAFEIVNPLIANYFDDVVTWGSIGARTCSSQPHRESVSSLPFPVGFKNSVEGNIELALQGMIFSKQPQHFLGINDEGFISQIQSKGNKDTQLILRGGQLTTNYDDSSIYTASEALISRRLSPFPIIDCAHGNSKKNIQKQKEIFLSLAERSKDKDFPILGLMIESFFKEGNQLPRDKVDPYTSITDPCISLSDTFDLIEFWHKNLSSAGALFRS